MQASQPVHVAVGVVFDAEDRVLISKRAEHLHQGGLWEFPGGKVEADETVQQALSRELQEELAIQVTASHPLIRIPYHYPDRHVLLDVWAITGFTGKARGMEGQPVEWVERVRLNNYSFPAANKPIVAAARLPDKYLVSGTFIDFVDFKTRLEKNLQQGVKLVQLRAKHLEVKLQQDVYAICKSMCDEYAALLLVNSEMDSSVVSDAKGIHLSSSSLLQMSSSTFAEKEWLAASVHDVAQLKLAHKMAVDFVVVSPVRTTASHPEAAPLGWDGLRTITEQAQCPVYALGGMQLPDIEVAWQYGAQGIAAIGALWGHDE